MIRFESATRKYGTKVAVDRLDLTVPAGEVFAFLGPNGAGKTTAIKMLAGLLQPTSGTVTVCGHNTVTSDPRGEPLSRLRSRGAVSVRQAHGAGVP